MFELKILCNDIIDYYLIFNFCHQCNPL